MGSDARNDITYFHKNGYHRARTAQVVLQLRWEAGTRVVVHLADYPAHGTLYNNNFDDYPRGDPYGGRTPAHQIIWPAPLPTPQKAPMRTVSFSVPKFSSTARRRVHDVIASIRSWLLTSVEKIRGGWQCQVLLCRSGLDPQQLVRSMAAKNIDYTFGEITRHTLKMTGVFAEAYENCQVSIRS